MSKDGFTFKVTKTSKGDADTDKDAGTNDTAALPIETKKYSHNSIGGGDKVDVFSFDGKAGEEYFIGIIPVNDYSGYLNLEVHDEYRQKITNVSTGSGAGVKSKPFKLPDDGKYFLQIEIVGDGLVDYSLALKRVVPLEGGPKTEPIPGE